MDLKVQNGRRGGVGGGGGEIPPDPLRNFLLFFFISNSRLCLVKYKQLVFKLIAHVVSYVQLRQTIFLLMWLTITALTKIRSIDLMGWNAAKVLDTEDENSVKKRNLCKNVPFSCWGVAEQTSKYQGPVSSLNKCRCSGLGLIQTSWYFHSGILWLVFELPFLLFVPPPGCND